MLAEWLDGHDPTRHFIASPHGAITFGQLGAMVSGGRSSSQVVAEPSDELESVIWLVGQVLAGAQVVVIEPRLTQAERDRRLSAAAAAGGQDASTVLFTSGTSGPARAVRLTAGNWTAAVQASASHLEQQADDVWLAAMPLHHVGGLAILMRCIYSASTVRWLPRFEAGAAVEALRDGVTMASLVPTMLRRILDQDRGSYQGVRAVLVGGGPIPAGLLEEARERGLPVLPTYGMTETCAQVATLRPDAPLRRAAHPLPGVELRIEPTGRIEVRGRQVSPGYAGEPDRGDEEWFTTPDLGALEPDGALRVLGRADDVIVSGGEKVHPGRVESELAAHPAVRAVAVVGVPDREWGEKVIAVYEGAIEPADLREWAGERLAPYEVPRQIHRVDRLPTVGPGKPDRPSIRQQLSPPSEPRE